MLNSLKFMRIVLIILIAIFVFIYSTSIIFAEENNNNVSTSSAQVNSFELFWPITSGKVEGDALYPIKLFKEQIGGWFIVEDVKKADYEILLGTKRVLEAEKHLKDKKDNFAINALEKADVQFDLAYQNIKKADSKKQFKAIEIRRDRLINIRKLIDQLKIETSEQMRLKLDSTREKADAMLRDYLP